MFSIQNKAGDKMVSDEIGPGKAHNTIYSKLFRKVSNDISNVI